MSSPPSGLHPSGRRRRRTGVSRRSCRGTLGRRRLGWRGGATAGVGQGRHEHERDQFQAFHTQSYSPCDLDQAKLEDKGSERRRRGQRNTSAVTENDIIVALRSNACHPDPCGGNDPGASASSIERRPANETELAGHSSHVLRGSLRQRFDRRAAALARPGDALTLGIIA
jgi:hypothetical protein